MKTYYTWHDIESLVLKISKQMARDQWKPDYIVGLTRGGLTPATMLSHWFDCKMWTLTVSLRDSEHTESNCWMAEDAYGYIPRDYNGKDFEQFKKKNILIVDDINDTGATLNWIKRDWQSSCLPNSQVWSDVWDDNVRVATLVNKWDSKSEIPVRYSGVTTTPDNDLGWIVFPWEKWSDE